jgi:hypothetical protein
MQTDRYTRLLEARTASLLAAGVPEDKIGKDSLVKSIKAKMKQLREAVVRITFIQDQTAKLKEMKEEKARLAAEEALAQAAGGGKKAKEKKAVPAKKGAPAAGKGKDVKKTGAAKGGAKAPDKKKGK